jgi:hypothetical protein
MAEDERRAQKLMGRVLYMLEACILLMVHEGEVGAIGMADKELMGYYVMKWLSKPYSLQYDTNGMMGIINAGVMVADVLYFNRVKRAPYWYTQSVITMVVKVMYVLQTGVQLQGISNKNKLPQTCNRMEAMWQKAVRVSLLDHEAIMDEAERSN